MPRFGGVLLLTATSLLVTYSYLFPASDHTADLTEVTRISAAPDRDYRSDSGNRIFSAASPVFHEVIPDEGARVAVAPPQKLGTWSTVVQSARTVSTPLKSAEPGDPETRAELASDLQRELKRVGCYEGEITGAWNGSTRRAMAAFMDRANATLPTDNPDYVLLALVQSHHDVVCSAECPAGQIADGGRCVPRAVVAQATKRSKRLEERRLAAARLSGSNQPMVTAEPEKLPWLQNENAVEVAAAPRPELPPGRMSIGAATVEAAPLPPPNGAAAAAAPASQGWKIFTLVPSATDAAADVSPKVAALGESGDTDDLSADARANTNAAPIAIEDDANAHAAKSKPSRRTYDEDRPRRKYASSGRGRRGDPRPGTMRYNVMQSLGGIY
ncbi:putative peptidoglycan binding domain-containing protein [Hyphomicrobium facile]|uniref:Putative peptidoglycan binding domain-containing protein n=1 Tax=Hyphomicrobium facile TaxID=51670 RepID=A0A1I7NBL7_9HYPH|nr:putative peptidoglycan binding domain-containing protein [Hyphomicrobium facile]SFV31973.1 Putative peptidoglycan binding domain-containing protein [Hyphomicrobium facile]